MSIKKSALCLVMAAMMVLPQAGIAFAGDEASQEITPFSDAFVYEETDAEQGEPMETENEPEEIPAVPEVSVEADPNQFLAGTKSIAGASVVTVAEPSAPLGEEPKAEDLTGELEADVPQPPQNPQTESEATDAIDDEGNNESGALFARVKLSTTRVKISMGRKMNVTVSYGGWFLGNITMRYTITPLSDASDDGLSAEWGSWSGKKNPMSITGYEPGEYTVTVEMYSNSKGRVLASNRLTVTVSAESIGISCNPSSVSMVAGGTASTVITHTGVTDGMELLYSLKDKTICSVTDNSTASFTVKGLKAGETTIQFAVSDEQTEEVLAYCELKIKVTDAPSPTGSVSINKSSASLTVGATDTATITTTGSGTLSVTSSSTSVCTVSLSGKTLTYKGIKAGTATITVTYKSGSTTLGTAKMTVTVTAPAAKPKIVCDKTSVSLSAGKTATLYFTVSDWPQNTAIVWDSATSINHSTARTWGDWNGFTIPLTIEGVSAGTDKYVISLCRKEDNVVKEVYSTCTVNVTVTASTANVSITPSASTMNLTVGAPAQTVRLTVGNSSSWSMKASVSSGTSCTIESLKGYTTYAEAAISASKSGTSTVTFTVTDKNTGKTASCQVTVVGKASNTPQVTLSPSTYTISVGETVSVGLDSFQAAIISKASGLTSGVTYNWVVSYTSSMVSVDMPYEDVDAAYIRGLKTGTTTIEVGVRRKGSTALEASALLTLKIVSGNAKNYSNYNYNFLNSNACGAIPLSTYQLMFPDALARARYAADGNGTASRGGVCYGMTATSLLFNDSRSGVTTSQFKSSASKVSALSLSDKSSAYNMTVQTFIHSMYLTQAEVNSQVQITKNSNDIAGLMDTLAKGTPVNLCFFMYRNGACIGGHSVLAYAVDAGKTTISIYDNNYSSARTIKFSKSGGKYTGVQFDYVGYDGANSFEFTWTDVPQMLYCWNNRGKLYDVSSMEKNYNFFYTNSDSFHVYDEKYDLVATYSNGVLDAGESGIMDIPRMNLDGEDAALYNRFFFPTGSYTIENCDGTVESFTASMTNTERTAEVQTDSDEISLNVADEEKVCEAGVSLDKAENYEIKLLSFADGEESKYISGSAKKDDAEVEVSLNDGKFADSVKDATIAVNGGDENGVYVEAAAGEGGSITPAGVTRVSKGQSLHFDITPDAGYEIADVLVNGESIGAVESYDYLDSTEDAAIYATFKKAVGLTVFTNPKRTVYALGDTFNPEGMQLRVMYSDGSAKMITEGFTCQAAPFTAEGEKTVTVSYAGLTANLTVNAVDVKVHIKTPSENKVRYGDTLMLHAEVNPAEAKVIWTSSDPSIAAVSADGGVTCLKSGKVTITATIDNEGDTANAFSDSVELECKGGFFWKIISFFKNLFHAVRIISEAADVNKFN